MFLWLQSPEVAVERVRERVMMGGHDVPERVIRRRYRRGAHNFLNLYRALADAWVLYDNSTAGDLVVVASGSGTQSTNVFSADIWRQFQEASK
jgi:predicted ABC-type ATPase